MVYLKREVFTAASSSDEPLYSAYYDDGDSELHYKFTAFGRCKSHTNESLPLFKQDILLTSTETYFGCEFHFVF
jgi:hypothetical protein